VAVIVAVLGGGAIVFPSLGLLFRLTLAGRFDQSRPAQAAPPAHVRREARPALLIRLAVACLIAGFGLLTVAGAAWAHALGVTALVAFIAVGFLALAPDEES
jgi:cytochrome d ubiquinol oxidase subunit II